MLMIMTNRGLNAVMDSQVRLGANVSVAVASVGAGASAGTTAAVGADIVAFAEARGLFGGVSLEGGVMSARVDENQAYYGQPLVARQIVQQMQGVNPGADPLREVLTRYGNGEAAPSGPPAYQSPPPYPPPYPPPNSPTGQPAYPPAYPAAPSYQAPQASPGYQPPPTDQPAPAYQPPPAYQAPPSSPQAPAYQAPAPGYAPPQAPSGYQAPSGQARPDISRRLASTTYPPTTGAGPIQQQSLPPPAR